jgi:hypothetical protein
MSNLVQASKYINLQAAATSRWKLLQLGASSCMHLATWCIQVQHGASTSLQVACSKMQGARCNVLGACPKVPQAA